MQGLGKSSGVFFGREPWSTGCESKITNCNSCECFPQRAETKNLPSLRLVSRGYSLGGPSGRSAGSCPVAMVPITRRKSNARGVKKDLPFNYCVFGCCFPALIYSLAAVGQLLKLLMYSDVFVWMMLFSKYPLYKESFQLSIKIYPFIIATFLPQTSCTRRATWLNVYFSAASGFYGACLVLCLCPCLSTEFFRCCHMRIA